jgi:hypothetical protein
MSEDATSAADTSPETMSDSCVKDEETMSHSCVKDEELEISEVKQGMTTSLPSEKDIKPESMLPPVLKTAMAPPAPKCTMAPPPPKCSSKPQNPVEKETAYSRPDWAGCPSAEDFPYFFEVNHFVHSIRVTIKFKIASFSFWR